MVQRVDVFPWQRPEVVFLVPTERDDRQFIELSESGNSGEVGRADLTERRVAGPVTGARGGGDIRPRRPDD